MSEFSHTQNWWNGNPQDFPGEFLADRRRVETIRLRSLLADENNSAVKDLWFRVRRAARLLELSSILPSQSERDNKVWEIIALLHETIGVVEETARDYEWLLSALAWQLAEAPSIGTLLASILISKDSF